MSDPSVAESSAEETRPARDTPGAKLEAERRRQGLSIPDVARHLKLAPRQVEALENDQYNALPGVVFVRGFMRNYARALSLDPEPLVRAAEQTMGVGVNETPMAGPTTLGKPTMDDTGSNRRGTGSRSWLSGLIVAALLAAGIGYFVYSDSFQKTSAPPPPAAQSVTPPVASGTESTAIPAAAPATSVATPATTPGATDGAAPAHSVTGSPTEGANTASVATATDTAAPPTSDKPELRFSFTKQSWVEIRDRTNKVIFSKPTDPGGERVVQGTPPFKVKVGNSSGVKLVYNGKEIDLKPHRRSNDVAYVTLE